MSALRTIPTRMKELLVKSRTLVVAATLLLMAWPAAIQAQEEGGLGLTVFAGAQNSPTAFDAFRSVEYDAGVRMGAGLVFFIDEYVSVRGSVAFAGNSGRETGAVSEDIDFSRTYYGAELKVGYPMDSGVAPYVFAGGGLVTVDRSSPSYSYDMTEGAGLIGLGASFRVNESVSVFAEGQGWIYSRQTVGGTQIDKTLNVGLTYGIPF